MRPRPDAAENVDTANPRPSGRYGFNEAAARCRGKPQSWAVSTRKSNASMRPRPDAAENADLLPALSPDGRASMRPRPDAAENTSFGRTAVSIRNRFNEAAARCRGKRARRPGTRSNSASFNEAAARCRGKPGDRRRDMNWIHAGFNEAAARCRGKRMYGIGAFDLGGYALQ